MPGTCTCLSQCHFGNCHIDEACPKAREPGNVREQKTSGRALPSLACTLTFKTSQWESLEVKCLIQSHNPQSYPTLSGLSLYIHTYVQIYVSLSQGLCMYTFAYTCIHVYMCAYICDVCILCIVHIYMQLRVLVHASICPVSKEINIHYRSFLIKFT